MPRRPPTRRPGPHGPPPWQHGPPPWAGSSSGARFLITDYAHSWAGDSLYVACDTDVPCHMFLRWTDKPTQLHIHEKLLRGVRLPGDPKYCFVEWLEVEQADAGDTDSHTFDFPSWGPCQRRWWHFRATEGGIDSPSTTGIFTAHYLDQEGAESLKHTDLLDKDPAGTIDHADKSVTGDKLEDDLAFGTFPTTPDADPDADLEVANKRYADSVGAAGLWVPIETQAFDAVSDVHFLAIPSGYATLMFSGVLKWVVSGCDNLYFQCNADGGPHYSYRRIDLGAVYGSSSLFNQGRAQVGTWTTLNRWVPFELILANADDALSRGYQSRHPQDFSSQNFFLGIWHTASAEISRVSFSVTKLNSLTGQLALAGIPAP